jgi:23S rRNA pseudouridine1911/1915/1917 synthase
LFTGRNHQIRVHTAEIGHPVVGDEYYGPFGAIRATSPPCPDEDGEILQEQRHALHAASLSFMHPILRTWMSFESAPPVDFWNLAPDSPA